MTEDIKDLKQRAAFEAKVLEQLNFIASEITDLKKRMDKKVDEERYVREITAHEQRFVAFEKDVEKNYAKKDDVKFVKNLSWVIIATMVGGVATGLANIMFTINR